MDSKHREIRAALGKMSPRRAKSFILGVGLPPYEAICLIECEVNGKSCVQVAEQLHVSTEFVKKKRRSAFGKIADEINNA